MKNVIEKKVNVPDDEPSLCETFPYYRWKYLLAVKFLFLFRYPCSIRPSGRDFYEVGGIPKCRNF